MFRYQLMSLVALNNYRISIVENLHNVERLLLNLLLIYRDCRNDQFRVCHIHSWNKVTLL
jgi:hypothetical protein